MYFDYLPHKRPDQFKCDLELSLFYIIYNTELHMQHETLEYALQCVCVCVCVL